jgi:hypothetical protein
LETGRGLKGTFPALDVRKVPFTTFKVAKVPFSLGKSRPVYKFA